MAASTIGTLRSSSTPRNASSALIRPWWAAADSIAPRGRTVPLRTSTFAAHARAGAPDLTAADRRQRRGTAVRRTPWVTVVLFCVAALAVIAFHVPPSAREARSTDPVALAFPSARPSINAYGSSGEVRVQLALPGEQVEYPLEVTGDPTSLGYQWVRLTDSLPADSIRALGGATVVAPREPGFYRLSLVRGNERQVVDELTLAVLVPFSQKLGGKLNGYRIGTYLAERLGARKGERPAGFVEVDRKSVV